MIPVPQFGMVGGGFVAGKRGVLEGQAVRSRCGDLADMSRAAGGAEDTEPVAAGGGRNSRSCSRGPESNRRHYLGIQEYVLHHHQTPAVAGLPAVAGQPAVAAEYRLLQDKGCHWDLQITSRSALYRLQFFLPAAIGVSYRWFFARTTFFPLQAPLLQSAGESQRDKELQTAQLQELQETFAASLEAQREQELAQQSAYRNEYELSKQALMEQINVVMTAYEGKVAEMKQRMLSDRYVVRTSAQPLGGVGTDNRPSPRSPAEGLAQTNAALGGENNEQQQAEAADPAAELEALRQSGTELEARQGALLRTLKTAVASAEASLQDVKDCVLRRDICLKAMSLRLMELEAELAAKHGRRLLQLEK